MKRTTLRRRRTRRRKGGAITRRQFVEHERALGPFYASALLVQNHLIPDLQLLGARCQGNDYNLLFAGSNGFALQFRCKTGSYYTVKIKMEYEQVYSGLMTDEGKAAYKAGILAEYNAINTFNSRHIMRAFKYFYFSPSASSFYVKEEGKRDHVIPVADLTNPNYKMIRPANADNPQDLIPYFGGLILEAVQKRFVELPANADVIKTVFKHYLTGLNEMNTKGFIHNDIKPDNLMYNKSRTAAGVDAYFGKIIDLGEIYDVKRSAKVYTAASQEYAPLRDIAKLQELIALPPAAATRSKAIDTQITSIVMRYDLYCLAKSFLKQYPTLETLSKPLHTLLTRCVDEDYTTRPSVSDLMVDRLLV